MFFGSGCLYGIVMGGNCYYCYGRNSVAMSHTDVPMVEWKFYASFIRQKQVFYVFIIGLTCLTNTSLISVR